MISQHVIIAVVGADAKSSFFILVATIKLQVVPMTWKMEHFKLQFITIYLPREKNRNVRIYYKFNKIQRFWSENKTTVVVIQ